MADVKQTIQDFYTQAQVKDFARNNLFRVLNIDFGGGSDVTIGEEDLVYVTTAALPGKTITDVAVPYMGLDFHIPGTVKYTGSEGYSLTFRADESYNLYDKFQQVMNDTFNDADSTGNYFTPTADSVIDLVQLDKQLERVSQYQLIGCSIRSIGEVAYDMTAEGTVQTFTVTVAYHYYRKTA
tara:strand:+ start:5095 stop:5640 length:546 start_codon:yes stop_codon:yes gene_type:complete